MDEGANIHQKYSEAIVSMVTLLGIRHKTSDMILNPLEALIENP